VKTWGKTLAHRVIATVGCADLTLLSDGPLRIIREPEVSLAESIEEWDKRNARARKALP